MSSDICLVNPGIGELDPYDALFIIPPMGLAYLASITKDIANTKIIDSYANLLNATETFEIVKREDPSIVGMNLVSNPNVISFMDSFFKKIKKYNSQVVTVVGGPHTSACPTELLRNSSIDIAVIGEGESTYKEVIEVVKNNRTLRKIRGIAYKEDGKVHVNKPRSLIKNLDDLPFPARNLLNNKIYKHILNKRRPMTSLVSSRGCPYQCTFCTKSVFGYEWRTRSPENIVEEIKIVKEDFGIREIDIEDDLFTLDKKRVQRICKLILKEKLDIAWMCNGRVNLIDRKTLRLMKKSGCFLVAYGIESGDPKILREIKKGITINQIKKAFKITREEGLDILTYIILGLPGETRHSFEKSMNLLFELNPDYVQFSQLGIYPGSKIYDKSKKKPTQKIHHLTSDELKNMQAEAYRRYYFRLQYLKNHLKTLKKIRSLEDLWSHFKKNLTGFNRLIDIILTN